jgi:ribosome assembly protein 1
VVNVLPPQWASQLTAGEAYERICRILEELNVIASSLYAEERFADQETSKEGGGYDSDEEEEPKDYSVEMDEEKERHMMFDPSRGNVVFASASHGWAFSVDDFAKVWAGRLGLPARQLRKGLWGPYSFSTKTNSIKFLGSRKADGATLASGASASSSSIMAVEMLLGPIWKVYETGQVAGDKTLKKLSKMASKLEITVDINPKLEPDAMAQAFMKSWVPLAPCVLRAVTKHLPCPREAGPLRAHRLLPNLSPAARPELRRAVETCRAAIAAASTDPTAPIIAYVSKTFAIPVRDVTMHSYVLPRAAGVPPKALEGCDLGFEVRPPSGPEEADDDSGGEETVALITAPLFPDHIPDMTGEAPSAEGERLFCFVRVFSGVLRHDSPVFVLGPRYNPVSDPSLYSLAPGSSTAKSESVPTIFQPREPLGMWLMMARDLFPIQTVPAGNVAAVSGLDACVIKSATVSSLVGVVPLASLTMQTTPLVRVAIEARDPRHSLAVERALRVLQRGDPCADVAVDVGGNVTLACLGPLHLERCLHDMKTRFAVGIELVVSPPIIPFRETLAAQASKTSAVTAASDTTDAPSSAAATAAGTLEMDVEDTESGRAAAPWEAAFGDADDAPFSPGGRCIDPTNGTVLAVTPDGTVAIRAKVVPIPMELATLFGSEQGRQLVEELAALSSLQGSDTSAEETASLSGKAARALESVVKVVHSLGTAWERRLERAVAFGGPEGNNLLSVVPAAAKAPDGGGTLPPAAWQAAGWVSLLQPRLDGEPLAGTWEEEARSSSGCVRFGWRPPSLWEASGVVPTGLDIPKGEVVPALVGAPLVHSLMSCIRSGFRLACESGPLCGEPLWGVGVTIVDVLLKQSSMETSPPVPLSGPVIGALKEAVVHGVRRGSMRLVEGWLKCQLTCSGGRSGGGEQMGALYAVIAKRRGRVVAERLLEGTTTFLVDALLPMASADGFAEELRTKTSGAATSPQLVFSHWERLDIDPFFRPRTTEEKEEWGDTVHAGQLRNTARELVQHVRRRKGLDLDRKVVVNAEKQRTRARKK